MIPTVIVGRGSHYQIGNSIGTQASLYIKANISTFWRKLTKLNLSHNWVIGKAHEEMALISPHLIDEIAGLALAYFVGKYIFRHFWGKVNTLESNL